MSVDPRWTDEALRHVQYSYNCIRIWDNIDPKRTVFHGNLEGASDLFIGGICESLDGEVLYRLDPEYLSRLKEKEKEHEMEEVVITIRYWEMNDLVAWHYDTQTPNTPFPNGLFTSQKPDFDDRLKSIHAWIDEQNSKIVELVEEPISNGLQTAVWLRNNTRDSSKLLHYDEGLVDALLIMKDARATIFDNESLPSLRESFQKVYPQKRYILKVLEAKFEE